MPRDLSIDEAKGMTVNERLWVSGLMSEYDKAVKLRDVDEMTKILTKIYLDEESIRANIRQALGEK